MILYVISYEISVKVLVIECKLNLVLLWDDFFILLRDSH